MADILSSIVSRHKAHAALAQQLANPTGSAASPSPTAADFAAAFMQSGVVGALEKAGKAPQWPARGSSACWR
jgi:hypothetical protein